MQLYIYGKLAQENVILSSQMKVYIYIYIYIYIANNLSQIPLSYSLLTVLCLYVASLLGCLVAKNLCRSGLRQNFANFYLHLLQS